MDLPGGTGAAGLSAIFGAGGALSRGVQGYAPRAIQLRMAQAVTEALAQDRTLVVEAGTGTGKTFAYLVPALLSGKRVVISTGTLHLQDQLFHRDLPRIRDALGQPVRVALLKGRANYLCRNRLAKAVQQPAGRHEAVKLQQMLEWSRHTTSGELSELGVLAEDDPLLPRVTSTAENCLGAKCPEFEACGVVKARRGAQAAEIVVVNHHLLFADFMLKDEGFGQILPGADAVIVDEAHQLPELATRFFGARVSTRQLQDLAQDTAQEAAVLGDMPGLRDAAARIGEARVRMEALFAGLNGREALGVFLRRPGAAAALALAREAVEELLVQLEPAAGRSVNLETARDRGTELLSRLAALTAPDADRGENPERVAWVEAAGRGGALHLTPIRIDADFTRLRETIAGAWVFTSATLATAEGFGHFCGQLGLRDARTLRLDSPFDFERQARMFLPAGLPEPSDPAYSSRIAALALPLIAASGGGAFVLCTSHRGLRDIAAVLREQLRLPLLVQGEGSRRELLAAFTAAGNAVLVGTASFWEGVDVRGLALRLVIIDKLPFAAPGDPVFEARLAAIRAAGGDPFMDHQVPLAITALRQGVGRLIRDPGDKGLLVLCDPRLRSRGYGRTLLASLPAMPEAETLGQAQEWLKRITSPVTADVA